MIVASVVIVAAAANSRQYCADIVCYRKRYKRASHSLPHTADAFSHLSINAAIVFKLTSHVSAISYEVGCECV